MPSSMTSLVELTTSRLRGDDASTGGRTGVVAAELLCQPALTRLYGDCSTLLEVRDKLGGDAVLNWDISLPIDHWRGVTLGYPRDITRNDTRDLRITALNLAYMGLNGHIPEELSVLDSLEVLNLGGNRLEGTIPSSLSNLAALWVLGLENNALAGTIPKEFGALRRLIRLHLGGNELSGPIPQSLSNLVNLQSLSLEHNMLTGSVPRWLGELNNLTELLLNNNRLHGFISPKIALLPRLRILRLNDNQFTECIRLPRKVTLRGYPKIEPDLLCQRPFWRKHPLYDDMAYLMLARDFLAGSARLNWSYVNPLHLWQGVTVLDGSVNHLDLGSMDLNGKIPVELGELRNLVALRLNGNRLTGSIPPELGKLNKLTMLSLEENDLTGSIPPELGNLNKLTMLSLEKNDLTGTVPAELGGLPDLVSLRLNGNRIDGPIPPELEAFKITVDRGFVGATKDDVISRTVRLPGQSFSDDSDDVLDNPRFFLWRLGFEKAVESPLHGYGLGEMKSLEGAPRGSHKEPLGVHNIYLVLLGESGIVPAFLFVLFIILFLKAQWRAPKSLTRDTSAGWIVVIALHGMTSQHVFFVAAAMFLVGLSVAMVTVRGESGVLPVKP